MGRAAAGCTAHPGPRGDGLGRALQVLRLINDLPTLSMVAQDHVDPEQAESPFVVPPLAPRGPDSNGLGQELAGATRELLERLFPDSDDERTMFARSLASIAERGGRADYATRVRMLFGVPDLDGDPPELADAEPQDD